MDLEANNRSLQDELSVAFKNYEETNAALAKADANSLEL